MLRVVHTFKFLPLQVNIRSSFSMFWLEVKLLGCYFHFSQLMWKRVKGDVYCVCQLANWTKIHLFVFDDNLINRGCILMVLIRLLYQVLDMQEIVRKKDDFGHFVRMISALPFAPPEQLDQVHLKTNDRT